MNRNEISLKKRGERPLFAGVYPAVLTPMHPDLSCHHKELAEHCQSLLNTGCTGIVLFGTTGEGTLFSVEERQKILQALIEWGIDPRKLIVGICCAALPDAIALARTALFYRCAGTLIVPPFFYKDVTEEGVITFYREVIKRVENSALKVILYHIPQYSGVPITLNIIKTLYEEFPGMIVGIKESEGNLDLTKQILRQFPNFEVLVGHEVQIAEAIQLGAIGAISGLANVYPELICSLYEYGKDPQKINENGKIKNIVQLLKDYPLFPAIKFMLEMKKGLPWHALRPPLIPLDKRERQSLKNSLAKH